MNGFIIKSFVVVFLLVVTISFATGNNFFFNIKAKISRASNNDQFVELRAQNNALKAEIAALRSGGPELIDKATGNKISATIYSSYPFNDKAQLTISINDDEQKKEVRVGDSIVVDRTLVGQIEKSLGKYAVVKTVFDPEWEFPVYIGPQLTRGLFTSGVEPKIVLISKKEKINPGDIIVTADPQTIPFRLAVGSVGQIIGEDGNPFWEVSVNLPYNINNLRQVFVRKNDNRN